MHAVKRWAAWTKRTVIGDAFVRRMPFWYRPALRVFERLAGAPLAERKAWSLQRLERVLQAAQQTEYGRQVGQTREITDWLLLDKDSVRESPARFLRTPQWRTVPASTSGTTGLPLKLFRSYASIGAEQAAIDWLYFARGYDPRKLRVAVLRGENIKPPSDRTPPFWRWDANGKRLVLSSNHLSADTIEDYYQILTEFAPDCLFAYPSALESLEPNVAYEAVRGSLALLGLDAHNYGTPRWNPLSEIIRPTDLVVIKPNMVRDFHEFPEEGTDALITHGSVVRAVLDYVYLAKGGQGTVIIADSPQNDADWEGLWRAFAYEELLEFYRQVAPQLDLRIYEVRKEAVRKRKGVVISRYARPGDPFGYSQINLGEHSEFEEVPHRFGRLYGAEYDISDTNRHHQPQVSRILHRKHLSTGGCGD
jgi:hypothetical protein